MFYNYKFFLYDFWHVFAWCCHLSNKVNNYLYRIYHNNVRRTLLLLLMLLCWVQVSHYWLGTVIQKISIEKSYETVVCFGALWDAPQKNSHLFFLFFTRHKNENANKYICIISIGRRENYIINGCSLGHFHKKKFLTTTGCSLGHFYKKFFSEL